MKNQLSVVYTTDELADQAHTFALQQGLSCSAAHQADTELVLNFTESCIELRDNSTQTAVHVDFVSGALEHRRRYGGGRGQTIAKAIGMKQGKPAPRIIDATAGLGKDAFVFACLGCSVTMIERSAIIARLVTDAMERASDNEYFQSLLKQGFELVQSNATDYLNQLTEDNYPDVIYLDPMYPERKKSAQVKKNMQLLQKLLGHDDDTGQLLNTALTIAKKRVVVKRPKGAEPVPGIKPTLTYDSKKTRYDTYIIEQH